MVANTALGWIDGIVTSTGIIVAISSVTSTEGGVVRASLAGVRALSTDGVASLGDVTRVGERVVWWAGGVGVVANTVVAGCHVTLVGYLRTFCNVVAARAIGSSGKVGNQAIIRWRCAVGSGEVGVGDDVTAASGRVANSGLAGLQLGNET